jgi:hypothetical protein
MITTQLTNPPASLLSTCALLAGATLAACNDQVQTGIEDLTGIPSFAVHRSDYESAAVALLDGEGKLLDASYISSGSVTPGLSAPLHGDIGLPTTACDPDVLTIVARFGGDYVLEVDLERSEVTRQVPTQQADLDDAAAYRGNPQDVLCLSRDVALVTRFEPNPNAAEGDLDQGDDIAVIDMQAGQLTGRIDLSQARVMVEGLGADGDPIAELAYARPAGMVRVGRFAVVGLGRMSASYIAADGMVAVVDLDARELTGMFAIDGLKNCVNVAKVSDREDAVIVQCSGYPFGDAASAGIALITVDAEGAVAEQAALRDQAAPPLFSSAVSLGGTRMLAVAQGDWTAETGDEAVIVDLESGDRQALFGASGPGTIGSGWFRSDSGLLLVPDAEAGVRLFEVADDEVVELEVVELEPVLPARSVRALRP